MEDIALAALPHDIDSEANSDVDSQKESDAESMASKSLTGAKTITNMPNDPASVLNPTIDGNFCVLCKRQLESGGAQFAWRAGDILDTDIYCSEACRLAYWNALNDTNWNNGTSALARGLSSNLDWKDLVSWDEGTLDQVFQDNTTFPSTILGNTSVPDSNYVSDNESMIAQTSVNEDEGKATSSHPRVTQESHTEKQMKQYPRSPKVTGLPYKSAPSPTSLMDGNISKSPPDTLVCHTSQCASQFTGPYRKSNLDRHLREVHGGVYPCEELGCSNVFEWQNARMKHYRIHHPRLYSAPAVSRKITRSTREGAFESSASVLFHPTEGDNI